MHYQICVRCVMDTTDAEISFDESGVCSHCKSHEARVAQAPFSQSDAGEKLAALVARIKARAKGEYDCIIGLSGGVDSSYVAYQAIQLGLKPLAVHFDNGWNSELAVKNIERMVKKLNLDLITYVIDWEEFRDIQRSFFKANVIDIEMVTDHAIFAALFKLAKQHKIRYILSGTNVATESIMPKAWQHFKFDLLNLMAIQKKFGQLKVRSYPTISIWHMAWNKYMSGFQSVPILNYLPYKKEEAIATLKAELGWEYYGGKHYESLFTKYYQAHILPKKFGVDKRKVHLSDLIMNGEVTRELALKELEKPPYTESALASDREYICKKLGFSQVEHDAYLNASAVSHFDYPSYAKIAMALVKIYRKVQYN
ncbi:N-acetyl sugar amidotransferase [Chitinimonas arctica]|uniref:N-acetyl sugar amidotransferase n=1 Tax=Chitinimonas arctica TaxID=2594795 RepID=A0A516SC51_9NEIS|nr:N-acetyl sugar amidotransferase [Chitinimonas arctica]QDQ25723.1 N-acetyl sugar amidotransferase [Chitinimonas arctica]